jgi:hypothetical protein
MRPKSVEVVELDGRVSEVLESRQKIQVRIPRFGVRTLRFSGVVL